MIDRLLNNFDRNSNHEADLAEKIGNMGLGLLRIGFGKTIKIEKMTDKKSLFPKKVYSLSKKVAALALFVLAFPITILLAGAGAAATYCSESHKQAYSLYTSSSSNAYPKERKVKFGQARVRIFNKNSSPKEIGGLNSFELIKKQDSKKKGYTQVRKLPPVGLCDTVIFTPEGVKSVHQGGSLFRDDEIIKKLRIVKTLDLGGGVQAAYTKNKKAIIQQQATRGCTAATAAMLIVDHNKKPNLFHLKTRNLGHDSDQIQDIQEAGLNPKISTVSQLKELRKLIQVDGSAIVSVSGKLGGHVIVVDKVSSDLSRVRLRDPYHGWEITVGNEAFLKEWHGGTAIQVTK